MTNPDNLEKAIQWMCEKGATLECDLIGDSPFRSGKPWFTVKLEDQRASGKSVSGACLRLMRLQAEQDSERDSLLSE